VTETPETYEIPLDELDDRLDDELESDVPSGTSSNDVPVWAHEAAVEVYGRRFEIEPPTIGVTLRILNSFAGLAVRGERAVIRSLQSIAGRGGAQVQVSTRAALFGMLAVLNIEDLHALGAAVLQFEDDREGRKFLRNPPPGEALKLAPLVRGLMLNLSKSDDLRDSLADFFDGMGMLENLVGGLTTKL